MIVSKESKKRSFFPITAYDEKGMLKQTACPQVYHDVVGFLNSPCSENSYSTDSSIQNGPHSTFMDSSPRYSMKCL